MVDLGFLLITFFMYTTTLARPKVMELQMPYIPEVPVTGPTIPGESTLILIPASGHRIAYYNGLEDPAESLRWCAIKGKQSLRALLDLEQKRVQALPVTFSRRAHQLHVLIRPDTSAAYEDIVHTLDEMAIGAVPYYSMMRITLEEQSAILKFSGSAYGKQVGAGL
jgi:biopolymer transport protein ExbD